MRQHTFGQRAHTLHPQDRRRKPRSQPRARSRRGQDSGRTAHQADDPGAYGKRGGRHHYKGLSGIALPCRATVLPAAALRTFPRRTVYAGNGKTIYTVRKKRNFPLFSYFATSLLLHTHL